MATSTSDDAAARRESFLRRLEQKNQQQQQEKYQNEKEDRSDRINAAEFGWTNDESHLCAKVTDSTVFDEQGDDVDNDSHYKFANKETVVDTDFKQTNSMEYEMTRGNRNCGDLQRRGRDFTVLEQYLTDQCRSKVEPSSMDWIQSIDDSSLDFLNQLASSAMDYYDDFHQQDYENATHIKSDLLHSTIAKHSVISDGMVLKNNDQTLMPDMTPSHTGNYSGPTNNGCEPVSNLSASINTHISPSSLELHMLNMMERQFILLQELQARTEALGTMMSQLNQDVQYLRNHSQISHGERKEEKDLSIFDHRRIRALLGKTTGVRQPQTFVPQVRLGLIHRAEGRQIPPPPPLNHQSVQRDQAPPIPRVPIIGPPQEQPQLFNRRVALPFFNHLVQIFVNFFIYCRTILLSTGIGRLYLHLYNQAIQRRAFANVDFAAIMKLLVMLLVFSGKMGRDAPNRNNNRGAHHRRAQENNNEDEEEGVGAYAAGVIQVMVEFVRGHKMHALILAAFIAFFIQVGLMTFFYDVLWVEREELLRVWLGRQRDVVNGNDGENGINDANNDVRNNEGQDVRNAVRPAAAVPEGVNLARGNHNIHGRGRVMHPVRGLIRRGPDGAIIYDFLCLIFSFILSLIPAWKPEEVAVLPHTEAQEEQQHDPQQQDLMYHNQDQDNDSGDGEVPQNQDAVE